MKTNFCIRNELWSHLRVEELVRCGVKLFVLSPGSRSTTLALAAASRPDLPTVVHYDERGAAFFAAGFARATLAPAALICTSGTATANFYPAVMEASNDHLPLILLTADRPPELQDCGANQTINQIGLYETHCRFSHNFVCPEEGTDYVSHLELVDKAVSDAIGPNSGPVHLNLMFREPLAPDPNGDRISLPPALTVWACSARPLTEEKPKNPDNTAAIDDLAQRLSSSRHVLIVAGRLLKPEDQRAVRRLAEMSGWLLVADVLSGLKNSTKAKNLINYYDILIGLGKLDQLEFDAVLHVGRQPTSKHLQQYLSERRPTPYFKIQEFPQRDDPQGFVTDTIQASIAAACDALAASLSTGKEPSTAKYLEELEAVIDLSLDSSLERSILTEPGVARLLSKLLDPAGCLFVASSRPIRDMDSYSAQTKFEIPVGGNRGVSGIDGTVASAFGFARGHDLCPVVLIGDLALLHDLNSLALVKEVKRPTIIVVINNNGGGIFSFLPVASKTEPFEKYFATPHDLSFEHAAAMYGFEYAQPTSVQEFKATFTAARQGSNSTLIEIATDRRDNAAVHSSLLNEIKARLNGD